MSARLVVTLAALLALGCRRSEPATAREPEAAAVVPGVESVVAAVEPVRDVVEAPAVVTPAGEPAEVRDARAALVETEARHELAVRQVRRNEALAQGAVTPRKELEAARAELAAADAGLARARQALAVVGGPGAEDAVAAGEAAVVARLVQRDVPRVVAGTPATVVVDALPGTTFTGRVAATAAYVDGATHLAPVAIHVRDADRVLRPGMTGSARIDVGEVRQSVVVPAVAVVYDEAQPVVFVDEGNGRFVARPVEVGTAHDGRVELKRGVDAGARVATTGAASLLSATRLPAAD